MNQLLEIYMKKVNGLQFQMIVFSIINRGMPELINSSENISKENCIFSKNEKNEIIVLTKKDINSGEQLFLNYPVERPNDNFLNLLKNQDNPPQFIENTGLSLELILIVFNKFNLIKNDIMKNKFADVFYSYNKKFWNNIVCENNLESFKHWYKIPEWVKKNWSNLWLFLLNDVKISQNLKFISDKLSSNINDQELKFLLSKNF